MSSKIASTADSAAGDGALDDSDAVAPRAAGDFASIGTVSPNQSAPRVLAISELSDDVDMNSVLGRTGVGKQIGGRSGNTTWLPSLQVRLGEGGSLSPVTGTEASRGRLSVLTPLPGVVAMAGSRPSRIPIGKELNAAFGVQHVVPPKGPIDGKPPEVRRALTALFWQQWWHLLGLSMDVTQDGTKLGTLYMPYDATVKVPEERDRPGNNTGVNVDAVAASLANMGITQFNDLENIRVWAPPKPDKDPSKSASENAVVQQTWNMIAAHDGAMVRQYVSW